MKFGIVMMLIASLSVALLSIPSKVAIAQTSQENQTLQPRGLTMPDTQSPENQTNRTGQPRGLTMPDTQSPENQTNRTGQTGQPRGLTMPDTPQGTSLNATSSQQQQGQQQQGQANETRSPQQSEARSGAQGQLPSGQQMSGPITAAEGGEPFGGQQMGTVSIDTTGRRTTVDADINDTPEEGNVFEGWLVDTGGSGYKLSLGQFRDGTLGFSQYMVNPYTYNNFEVTEEPAEDPDPNAADSIAGFELQDPFGQ